MFATAAASADRPGAGLPIPSNVPDVGLKPDIGDTIPPPIRLLIMERPSQNGR